MLSPIRELFCLCIIIRSLGKTITVSFPVLNNLNAPVVAELDTSKIMNYIDKVVENAISNVSQKMLEQLEARVDKSVQDALKNAYIKPYEIEAKPTTGKVKDCTDIRGRYFNSGVYHIYPKGHPGYKVYCDMTTDGGGWTVFQRRYNGAISFHDKLWNDYRYGFGNVSEEYWLGNDRLHELLSLGHYVLRVQIEDWAKNTRHAEYDVFNIGSASDNYRLTVGKYNGDAGDSLATSNQTAFSTTDEQHDSRKADDSCASVHYIGAWWYPYPCGNSSLNGEYLQDGTKRTKGLGLMWIGWQGIKSMKKTTMMLRRI